MLNPFLPLSLSTQTSPGLMGGPGYGKGSCKEDTQSKDPNSVISSHYIHPCAAGFGWVVLGWDELG